MRIAALLLVALFALLILPAAYAGWYENVEVRVLDAHLRPIPNASVNITYQISQGKGYSTTKNRMTDVNGRIKIFLENVNYDITNETTDFAYLVRARYGTVSAVGNYTYNNGSMPRTLKLPVVSVTFFAKDTENKPLKGVPITVSSRFTARTDQNGMATMLVEQTNQTLTATYGTFVKEMRFDASDDRSVNITFKLYEVIIRVLDDNGLPLDAELHLGTAQAKTNQEGYAYFYNITDSQPLLNAYYGRYKKSRLVNLEVDKNILMLFDTHPPVIQPLPTEWDGRQLKVRAIITDQGDYASGLRDGNSSMQIYYIDRDGAQKKLAMYSVGHNLYEGVIPLAEDIPAMRYIVQATDAEGNSKSSSDTFVIPTKDPSAVQGGGKPPIDTSSDKAGLASAAPAGMLVLLIVLVMIGAWYYTSKKGGQPANTYNQKQLIYSQTKGSATGGLGGTVPSKSGGQEGSKPAPPPIPPAPPKQ